MMANLPLEEEFWLSKFTRESELFAHYRMLLSASLSNSSPTNNSSFHKRCVAAARRRRNYAASKLREVQKNKKEKNP